MSMDGAFVSLDRQISGGRPIAIGWHESFAYLGFEMLSTLLITMSVC